MVHWLTSIAEDRLQTTIHIGKVDYQFFNKIVLDDVYMADQQNDTLIYSKHVTANLKHFSKRNRQILFSKVELDSAKVYLFNDTASHINIRFFTKALKPTDTTRKGMQVNIQSIHLTNSIFSYKTNKNTKTHSKIDFDNMVCNQLEIVASDFKIYEGVLNMQIDKLAFIEKSGFEVYKLKSHFYLDEGILNFHDLSIRTPYSYINADSLNMQAKDFRTYRDFEQKVKLNAAFTPSNVGFYDLSYFSTKLERIKENVTLEGLIYGRVSNLKSKNLWLNFGKQSELVVDFSFSGLPDINETFMYIDVQKLITYQEDLTVINSFINRKDPLKFPDQLSQLGAIEYKGNFTGFLEDFVTYGNFTTHLGKIATDISIKPGVKKELAISGNLKTVKFRVGEFFGEHVNMKDLTMNVELQGTTSPKNGLRMRTKGVIDSIDILNYNYKNINLDGFLTQSRYDGSLYISDPNIILDFRGQIDFSGQIPLFNFQAAVPKANLYQLHVDSKDTTAFLSFNLGANFAGNSPDNAEGEIILTDLALKKKNEWLREDTLELISRPIIDARLVAFNSSLITAKLKGKYATKSIIPSLKKQYYKYLPSQNPQQDELKVDKGLVNSFSIQLVLTKTAQLSRFFLPQLTLSDSTTIELSYDDKKGQMVLSANADAIRYHSHMAKDVTLKTFSNDSLFTTLTKFGHLNVSEGLMHFDNLELSNHIRKDTLNTNLSWQNKDTLKNAGQLYATTAMSKNPDTKRQSAHIQLFPSQVYLNDSLWQFQSSHVLIDSCRLELRDFKLFHKKQSLTANGVLSKEAGDSIHLRFKAIDLKNIQSFIPSRNLQLSGIVNGQASFSDLYTKPLFSTNLSVDSLTLNESLVGNTSLTSTWNNKLKTIDILGNIHYNQQQTLALTGSYAPNNGQINAEIKLQQMQLASIGYFMRTFASDLQGQASGTVYLNGTLIDPDFTGFVMLQNGAMTIDYLKTRYSFTNPVVFNKHILQFSNMEVLDSEENKARLNGSLALPLGGHPLSFDFNIQTPKFLALNTTSADNEDFYGKAYLNGIVSLSGTPEKIRVDVSGATIGQTQLNIPVTSSDQAQKSDFITFVSPQQQKEQPTPMSINSNEITDIDLNFDLEVTPEAETRLIFDSQVGDLIRAKGYGNLKLQISSPGNFNMYGDYNIEEGDYLFTLQNVVNKKFALERGGQILWSGDPYNAQMDIDAVYKLKTSLLGLQVDTSDIFKKRIPVECRISMTEDLVKPDIAFQIGLPSVDPEVRTRVENALNTQEKINKQFLSLLVLNTFQPVEGFLSSAANGNSQNTAGIGTVTASELLSNQLSNWLSQISNDWDIGVNYRPGDELSRDQVEVALSTQLFNDRVTINGNVGYGKQYTQTSDLVGDFILEFKLTKNGKLRLKAFNETNDRLIDQDSPYTQGVGLFYREEFNTFGDLWRKFSKPKKKETEKTKDKEASPTTNPEKEPDKNNLRNKDAITFRNKTKIESQKSNQ